jgi:hypothetical protein
MRFYELCEGQFDNADLKRRYDHFNSLLFDGQLPDIPVEYAKLKNVGGQALAKVRGPRMRYAKRTLIPGSLRIQMSTFYQRDQQSQDAMLIHEMIHVHFISIGDFEESHGYKFVRMCRELGQKVGFDIPLTDDVTGLAMTDAPKRKVGVIILTKKEGGQSVAVVGEAYIRANLDAVLERWKGVSHIAKVDVIVTTGRIEGRYPVQRKDIRNLSYYIIKEPALIDEAMQNAEVLGTVIN